MVCNCMEIKSGPSTTGWLVLQGLGNRVSVEFASLVIALKAAPTDCSLTPLSDGGVLG